MGEVKHASDHLGIRLFDEAVLSTFGQQQEQFLGIVDAFGMCRRADGEEMQDTCRALVEQPDRRPKNLRKQQQGRGHPTADTLWMQERQRFRRQLAQDNMQKGNTGKRQRPRHRMRCQRGKRCW